ncbi:MAG: uroporphyrinogen-III synthase [Lysobacterales bacterium]
MAGRTIVLTRPVGDARTLVRAVRRLGGRPVVLPGSSLRAVAEPPTGLRVPADIRIYLSPAAVRFASRFDAGQPATRTRIVLAPGAATVRALHRRGIDARCPVRFDSEGLLELPELKAVRGKRVVLIGAPGGRDVLANALRGRGAVVTFAVVYQRCAPRLTRRHADALADAPSPWITLLSSAAALAHLAGVLPAGLVQRWRGQAMVVSSERLAAIVHAAGFRSVAVAASAAPAALLATAADVAARRRKTR